MLKPRILIADADKDFLQSVQSAETQVSVTGEADSKGAKTAIADPKVRYSAICLNVGLDAPSAIPLLRFTKFHRPAVPLHLLADAGITLHTQMDLEALHIQGVIQKPVDRNALLEKLIPGSYFNVAEALEVSRVDTLKAGETKEADEGDMHAIDSKSFLCGQKSFFDVYVKLGAGKFLMILKAGDQFDADRVMTYLRKGVAYFYIKRQAQLYYLQYCDRMTQALLDSDKVSLDAKATQMNNLGRETFEYLKSSGISETTLSLAQNFVSKANQLMTRTGLNKAQELLAFFKNESAADHGTSTVMLTALIVQNLGFRDEKAIGVITMGAFMHDIGLLSLSPALHNLHQGDEEDIAPELREEYETHPVKGGEMLLKVPHVNPLLPQIAQQHHERRTRKGFPSKLGSGAISMAAEVVGLAELVLHIMKPGVTLKEVKDELQFKHADEFSVHTLDSLFKVLK